MPGISPKTRFYRAKRMSLTKWNGCVEITEEEFKDLSFSLLKDTGTLKITAYHTLGFSPKNCGFCAQYYNENSGGCSTCPLHDLEYEYSCCKEWSEANVAGLHGDFPAYHAAAVALRDRIAGMEYEEES